MFNLFKKKSKVEILNKQYQNLLKDAHRLSTINRKERDAKMAEADRLSREIESLQSA